MSESVVKKVKQLVQQSIDQVESSLEVPSSDERALTRALALLWAAHDELGLVAKELQPFARVRAGVLAA